MRIIQVSIVVASMMLVAACSEEKKAEGYSKPANQAASTDKPAATPNTPGSNMPAGHPGANTQSGAPSAPAPLLKKELAPGAGTVIKAMHSGGYTYMEVDVSGKPTWIAATAMKVKTGQKVQWQDGAVMKNFSSNSLHRTFDEIVFVSNASMVE